MATNLTNGTCTFLHFLSSFVQINIALNVHFIIFHMIFHTSTKCLQHKTCTKQKKNIKNLQLPWQNEKWMAFCNKFIWWLRESNYRQCVFFYYFIFICFFFHFLIHAFRNLWHLYRLKWLGEMWKKHEQKIKKLCMHTPAKIFWWWR